MRLLELLALLVRATWGQKAFVYAANFACMMGCRQMPAASSFGVMNLRLLLLNDFAYMMGWRQVLSARSFDSMNPRLLLFGAFACSNRSLALLFRGLMSGFWRKRPLLWLYDHLEVKGMEDLKELVWIKGFRLARFYADDERAVDVGPFREFALR